MEYECVRVCVYLFGVVSDLGVLKCLSKKSVAEIEERVSNYSYSLSFQSVKSENLCIATFRNVFGRLKCCIIIVVNANNDVKNVDRIRHCPTNGSVPSKNRG